SVVATGVIGCSTDQPGRTAEVPPSEHYLPRQEGIQASYQVNPVFGRNPAAGGRVGSRRGRRRGLADPTVGRRGPRRRGGKAALRSLTAQPLLNCAAGADREFLTGRGGAARRGPIGPPRYCGRVAT